jgi:hypothetical protein
MPSIVTGLAQTHRIVAGLMLFFLAGGIDRLSAGDATNPAVEHKPPAVSFGEEPPGTWEFTLQSSYQFIAMATPVFLLAGRIEKNPLRYHLATQVLSARCLPTRVWGSGILRGRLEVSANVVGSAIVKGPESFFVGIVPGLRYYFVQPHAWLLPYVELSGGPGLTDSRGFRFAQQQDFTFTYLLGVGVKGRIGSRSTFTVSVLDQHMSNAYLTHPNYGFDSVGFGVSFGHSF